MSTDEPFRLVNDIPAAKPVKFENNERSRQTKLFSGLDCLPGQLDLFDADSDGSTVDHEPVEDH